MSMTAAISGDNVDHDHLGIWKHVFLLSLLYDIFKIIN